MDNMTILNYLSYCQVYKRLSPHTIRAYKNDLKQFQRSEYDDVKDYINFLNVSTYKTSTLRRKIACLKAFYKYLSDGELIEANPFHQLRFQFQKEKTLPKIIPVHILKEVHTCVQNSLNQAKTLYQREKRHRNFLIISLLLSTGIRVSELCHIELSQIDLNNRTISILGKGKKERIIYLGDDSTYHLLNEYISQWCPNPTGYLFLGKDKEKPLTEQSVRLVLNKVAPQLNLNSPLTPHMFRHSFATMLLDRDVDIRYIQHILGHSSITVTQIYTHVSQQKQREILSINNPLTSIIN
ncbi:integrase [Streptococcus dysgalactiae subsp. dysgalactiae]|nr:tyrosine-type recombinase/integrase [Streptococcus dysgalactiae]QGG98475.1 integrase [Streptococcus dysgalactiae subsp. dysgalactiae]